MSTRQLSFRICPDARKTGKQDIVGGVTYADPQDLRSSLASAASLMEVFILGGDDRAMCDRPIPDGIILRISQPGIAYSGRVMPAFRQPRTQGGRQIGIDKKLHAAVVNTG